ncbi:MAG: hypothetical protein WAT39_10040 [Planctomycetota bacterium]
MRTSAAACLAIPVLAALLRAQGTYIVSTAATGAFTEITTAVAAVPNGSVLIVRPGTYARVVVDAKHVAILCDPDVFAAGNPFLEISNIAASQRVVVRGLRASGSGGLSVNGAAGRVAIDGTNTIVNNGCSFFMASQVCLRGYVFWGASNVMDSQVVLEACSFAGLGPGAPALAAYTSTVQAVQCSFVGGAGVVVPKFGALPGGPGVQLSNSSFRAMGRTSDRILAGGSPPGFSVPPVQGTGSARVEPAILVQGSAPVSAGIAFSRPVMPSLLAASGPPGGAITVTRFGATGLAFVVVVSLPGPVGTVPGLADPVWLDLASANVEALAIAYGSGGFQVQKPVPMLLQLRGVELHWHAIDLELNGGYTVSNPSHCVVH